MGVRLYCHWTLAFEPNCPSVSLPQQLIDPLSSSAHAWLDPTEMDIAVVGSGVCLTLDDSGTCTAAKVVLGAVGPTIINCEEAANALIGTKVDEAAIEAAGAAATAAATPISDKRGTVEYRKKIAGVLTRRATATALERAKG